MSTQKGFTLFVALIVSSVMLAVGFSIGNIVLKQLTLSSAGKESQIAFFAADSGAECALYWDRKDREGLSVLESVFAPTSNQGSIQSAVRCGTEASGAVKSVDFSNDGDTMSTSTFFVNYTNPDDPTYKACAKVMVVKNGPFTVIETRGYNADITPNNGCDLSHPRTVERGLRINY